jgi:hypothetical protein
MQPIAPDSDGLPAETLDRHARRTRDPTGRAAFTVAMPISGDPADNFQAMARLDRVRGTHGPAALRCSR